MLTTSAFIKPMSPTLRKEPPDHPAWCHEVKFDGYRIQIHKDGTHVALYSKNGNDFTDRYPAVAAAMAKFPTKAVVLDGELTICDDAGNPDFNSLLMKRHGYLCVWVFDILSQFGKDLRHLPLVGRHHKLDRLMERIECPVIRQSRTFLDPHALLRACAQRKLEGIVSKRLDRPYISGPSKDWIKVKCSGWREANTWRHEFFNKDKHR